MMTKYLLQGAVTITLLIGEARADLRATPSEVNEIAGVTDSILPVVGGLVAVLCLFFFLVWLMKRLQGGRGISDYGLQVVGGLSFGMRDRVVLIKAHQRHVLVSITGSGMRTLSEWDESTAQEPFGSTLNRELGTNASEGCHE